jgi:hypothetical protein
MKAQPSQTLQILQRFNQAFVQHDGSLLGDLIAEDCVMESVEPAPDGTRYVGRSACLEFWQKLPTAATVRSPTRTSSPSMSTASFGGADCRISDSSAVERHSRSRNTQCRSDM